MERSRDKLTTNKTRRSVAPERRAEMLFPIVELLSPAAGFAWQHPIAAHRSVARADE
jgi:hypothetical protein